MLVLLTRNVFATWLKSLVSMFAGYLLPAILSFYTYLVAWYHSLVFFANQSYIVVKYISKMMGYLRPWKRIDLKYVNSLLTDY